MALYTKLPSCPTSAQVLSESFAVPRRAGVPASLPSPLRRSVNRIGAEIAFGTALPAGNIMGSLTPPKP